MKLHFALLLGPLLVQCSSSSSSHGSSGDTGADDGGDAAPDVTSSSSSSGGVGEAGSSSDAGDSSSGSSGSGSGGSGSGGSGSGGATCGMVTGHEYVKYMVTDAMSSNVITMSFAVDATYVQQTAMPADYWVVLASGSSCFYPDTAQLRLGGDISTDAGGLTVPTTPITWTIGGKEYPQSVTDAAISLSEATDPSMGTGNYWLSSGGTITGMPIGTGCYELDFTNVVFARDAALLPTHNKATGDFIATGMARVGANCP